jgi:hypothetical protein
LVLGKARTWCRHTIGLNYTAIGIEMVMQKFGIPLRDVTGHAMATGDRHFRDLEGWANDHTDWEGRDVKRFRERLRRRYHL